MKYLPFPGGSFTSALDLFTSALSELEVLKVASVGS
jgi:hypothetical protein